jgi:hypothetical protein
MAVESFPPDIETTLFSCNSVISLKENLVIIGIRIKTPPGAFIIVIVKVVMEFVFARRI